MDEGQRDEIIDSLPKDMKIVDADDDIPLVPGTLKSWGGALGHAVGDDRRCEDCGPGITCVFLAFYDSVFSSVVRELDKQGLLVHDLIPIPEDEDKQLNDPFDLWGSAPSYRCYVGRHKDCEPEGAETGCTCSCGHQEPICACRSTTIDLGGNLQHREGCPQS